MSNVKIPNFIQGLGHHILSYILNIDDISAKNILTKGYSIDQFTDKQNSVLRSYIELCGSLKIQILKEADFSDFHLDLFYRLQLVAGSGQGNIFNDWRELNGGNVMPELAPIDEVSDSLLKAAVDAFPLFLLQEPKSLKNLQAKFPQSLSFTRQVMKNFASYKFSIKMCAEDACLNKILPAHVAGKNCEEILCRYHSIFEKQFIGINESFWFGDLPGMIMFGAYRKMRLRDGWSLVDFLEFVKEGISQLKILVSDGEVDVPILMIFYGIRLPDNSKLSTQFGVIKNIDDAFLEFVATDNHHFFKPHSAERSGVYLEFNYSCRAYFNSPMSNADIQKKLASSNVMLDKRHYLPNRVKLAFLLGVKKEDHPVCVNFAGCFTGAIFGYNPLEMSMLMEDSLISRYICSHEDINSLKEWFKIVHNARDENIKIAIKRLLSAVNSKKDQEDRFVDACIALENLFSDRADATFRIGGAVARILGKDFEDRENICREVRDIYDKRSNVVHGKGKKNKKEKVAPDLIRCLNILINSLRVLYANKPHLLELDSSSRSQKIILE